MDHLLITFLFGTILICTIFSPQELNNLKGDAMIKEITGLHHITSMASNADANNVFFTKTLGLRRVKKTVNFDAPEVYHLYYGDEIGTPGSIMTDWCQDLCFQIALFDKRVFMAHRHH